MVRVALSLARWLTALQKRAWEGPPWVRAYRFALLLCLVLGVVLRLNGQLVGPNSLWLDEAHWAEKLLTRPVLSHRFRPIAFMWMTKQLAEAFGPTEFWLRFVSNVSSIVVLLLVPYVASRLLKTRLATLLVVLLFALHPALIDHSKEFKPYSFEVLVHLLPIVLYLRFRQTERRAYYYGLLVTLPLLFFFAYNIAFIYPAVLLILLWRGWQSGRVRGVLPVALCGAVCLAVVGGWYAVQLRGVANERTEAYWGRKYDVFYDQKVSPADDDEDERPLAVGAEQRPARVDWLVEKYNDVAALPGLRRELWQAPAGVSASSLRELASVERLFWIALHLFGLGYLASRRRFEELMLLATPLACVVVLNLLGQWPAGAFRTNLFLCVPVLLLAGIAADGIAQSSVRRSVLLAAAVAVLTLIPGFALGFDWHRSKQTWTRDHKERVILQKLRAYREEHLRADPALPRERLLMDPHSFVTHDFYLDRHPFFRARDRSFFRKNFVQEDLWKFPTRIKRLLKPRLDSSPYVWLVVSKPRDMEPVKSFAAQQARILKEERLGDDHMILLLGRK